MVNKAENDEQEKNKTEPENNDNRIESKKLYDVKDFTHQPPKDESKQPSKQVQVPTPKAVILRFYDVISSWNETLKDYVANTKNNLVPFLEEYWEEDEMKELVSKLRYEAYEEKLHNRRVPRIFKSTQSEKAIRESVVYYVNWKLEHDPQMNIEMADSAHNTIQRMVWFISYSKGLVKTRIHSDFECLKAWKEKQIKVCLFSACSQALIGDSKTILSQTTQGDINSTFDHFFDTTTFNRFKYEEYEKMAKQMNIDVKNLLFITNYASEARVTALKGLPTVLMKRTDHTFNEQDVQLPPELKAVSSLADIIFI